MTPAPDLILPITDLQVNTLVKWGKDPDQDAIAEKVREWAEHAPIEQVVCALLIQQVPSLVSQGATVPAKLERALAHLIDATSGADEAQVFRDSVPEQLKFSLLTEGARQLGLHGVDVLRQSEVETEAPPLWSDNDIAVPDAPDFLDDQGRWDYAFSKRQHERRNPFVREVAAPSGTVLKMTDPQARFFNTFLAEPDESSDLMSFFGGGKTFLARAMLEEIGRHSEFNPVILALTRDQLAGLQQRLQISQTASLTFGQLAGEILAGEHIPIQWRPGKRRDPNYMLTSEEIARRMEFAGVGKLSPATVADVAQKAVRSFCRSGHERVQARHLPRLKDQLTELDRHALVASAQRLWEETVEPSSQDSQLPVRAYHLIKYCALRGFVVPERYTHLIIDEAHDLSPPLVQILDRSPQSIQTMGDPYQRTHGFMPRRSPTIRRNEIGLTVRASNQVEPVFNTLIEKHPVSTGTQLEGSRSMRTRISYYDPERPRIPREKCTVLVSDPFELFEWFHRLKESQTSFSLLPASARDFFSFNTALIDLYYHNVRARNPLLFRYPDWESLRQSRGHASSFRRVEAMFSGGKSEKSDFMADTMTLTEPAKATVLLGLAEHARNMEFNRVMLAPDLLMEPGKIRDSSMQAHVLSMIYIGASRARYELMLPGHLKHWLETQPRFETETHAQW